MLFKRLKNYFHFFYALFGAVRFGFPSEKLLVIGVTGTSGKSSTIFFLRQVLEFAGFKVGELSTIEFCVARKCELNDKKMTMLGRTFIQRKLREMVQAGCQIALVEITSEGFLQYRHKFINYDIIVLTNLYPEHIEAHGGFENYKAAKLGIFEYVSKCERKILKQVQDDKLSKTAIVNEKSEYADEFLQYNFEKKIKSSAEQIEVKKDGLNFVVENEEYFAPLYGEHNAENLACVIAIAKSLNISTEKIKQSTSVIKAPPGRIEFIPALRFHSGQAAEDLGFQVIVDYAFEPVALQKLYDVVRLLCPKRVIHVCGSTGGGRDKARREPIGKLVGEKADIFIVTDEDPYEEDPLEIIKAVSTGAQSVGKKLGVNLFEILDRGEAIKKAIAMAKVGDLLLITGKGSEQAMCLKSGMIKWDDRKIIREALL